MQAAAALEGNSQKSVALPALDFISMETKSMALDAQTTLIIKEDEELFLIYMNEPEKQPFLYMKFTFEEMRETGFADFSRMLGKHLILGQPALLALFEADIGASTGDADNGDLAVPSVDDLEQPLFSALESRSRKVSMIVMQATERFPGFWSGADHDARVDEALSRLAARDDVLSFGDIKDWRHSEMCRRAPERRESGVRK